MAMCSTIEQPGGGEGAGGLEVVRAPMPSSSRRRLLAADLGHLARPRAGEPGRRPPRCGFGTRRRPGGHRAAPRGRRLAAAPESGRFMRAVFVVLGDQPVEQAQAERGRALRDGRRVLAAPGHAGDVEMRPGAADEALDELRADDGAAGAAADVLHVGDVGLDQLVVGLAERHAPQRLAGRLAGGEQAGGQRVVVAEHARRTRGRGAVMMAPVRVARSTVSAGLKRSCAYQITSASTQAALGVGVQHLDGLAGEAA